MKKSLPFAFLLIVLLFGCSNSEPEPARESELTEDKETVARPAEVEVVAENLDIPWSINRLDGTFYISERPGTIMKIQNGRQTRQKVNLKKKVSTASEAGFLGFVLAPDFRDTGRAYAYYTYENETGQFNRIVELLLRDDEWQETRLLLDKIPSGNVHHGGRLKIGPDGKLYATTGDATEPESAQDLDSLGGKILRLNLDGSIPEDNPFKGSYVHSYGHRNSQGMAWDEDGTMYATEHGPSAHDEINRISPGKNYGWPIITGTQRKPELEAPIFESGEETWAPSGMAAANGKLYVAGLRGNAVLEFNLETGNIREAVSGLGRIRDVMIDGDYLYFVSNNTDGRGVPGPNDDKLYRIPLADLQ
ncbi:PQQ-dependent sugar dehydrogenase [Bacillus sp. T33-2]|uniref:PQQ-dependent sugar dehydrogenase n=1 Tax=Bacillus sp. T33-2 TaxID=2054168 RepID=UPI000C776CBB|nr:sorbosone dehydrogenase family protein [Bacillus sp. T33-2]PLR96552.1 quinoprotein glucose dehydrogenase [Bacillus sp. T33-2]